MAFQFTEPAADLSLPPIGASPHKRATLSTSTSSTGKRHSSPSRPSRAKIASAQELIHGTKLQVTQSENGVIIPVPAPEKSQTDRSEERRVGKECRSRWSPY